MPVTDSVADMLTRIRNGLTARHDVVEVPASNVKKAIGQILLQEGYIKGCEFIDDGVQGTLRIKLKYGAGGEKAISGLKKISKPGLRVYARHDKLPRVLNGLGIAIISTSNGIITDAQARRDAVGGEVLAYIW